MKEHNQYYWENRDLRKETAKKHTQNMERTFSDEIARCVASTRLYDENSNFEFEENTKGKPTYRVVKTDSVSAIFECKQGNTAVLNFASYKYPGGGFLAGSRAQEECLCHESFLYNVLSRNEEYYEWNRKHLNRALYKNRALYSPDIIFERNGMQEKCSVITCAAPNFSTACNFVDKKENDRILNERIRFILNIAKKENVDTLILGAFGCGVFQQDAETVAKLFKKNIDDVFSDKNINIVFAVIPPLSNQKDNAAPFENVFG